MWRSRSSGEVLLIHFALGRGRDGLVPARRLRLERGEIPRLLREGESFGGEHTVFGYRECMI